MKDIVQIILVIVLAVVFYKVLKPRLERKTKELEELQRQKSQK